MDTFVNFRTAERLNKRGYNEGSFFKYTYPFGERKECGAEIYNAELDGIEFESPTITKVLSWLDKEHFIWISVSCDCGSEKLFTFKIYGTRPGEEKCLFNGENYETALQAYEAALYHTLKRKNFKKYSQSNYTRRMRKYM